MIAASVLLHQQCRSEQLIKRKIKIESLRGKEKSEFQEKNLISRAKWVRLLLPVHNCHLLLLLFYLALKAWRSLAKPLGPSPTSPAASCLVEEGHQRWGYSQRIRAFFSCLDLRRRESVGCRPPSLCKRIPGHHPKTAPARTAETTASLGRWRYQYVPRQTSA